MITEVELSIAKKEYARAKKAFDKYICELAYNDANFNKRKTAKLLGISRSCLYRKLKRYMI